MIVILHNFCKNVLTKHGWRWIFFKITICKKKNGKYKNISKIVLEICIFRESLSQSTRETNVDKTIVGLACLAGAVSGGLDVTSSATSGEFLIVIPSPFLMF